ncbi:MAG: Twitching motility protein PilT [uncultured Thiotrichaceae bacterium]|uniref:Twitching motility protein PilT n=1 Tax=uncultured Thiotrichaceae bacterium TaxID=298394 RepID=A0A6S6TF68_9GAMM|nr:MAG: Twitching motility protein PilT [uncultured Thiotrichaceae bacterium]
MKITPYLEAMVKQDASDLYLTTDAPACLKIMGSLHPLTKETMREGNIAVLAQDLLSDEEWKIFQTEKEMNRGLSIKDLGRFRTNIYFQRGEVSMVIRHIRSEVQKPEDLNMPAVLKDLVMGGEGLILFVGSTGSGKSTSMASLIQYRNLNHAGHILTVEDPIEFAFKHEKSIIGQREVGYDTLSYQNAMREAMREAPDLIMIGETRDTETMEAVMGFADTGHLVISTLHATNTTQALERILYMYPPEQKSRILMDLSLNLKGIVAQRLVPDTKGGVVLASEVLVNTPFISETIRNGNFPNIQELLEKGKSDGMHTFDQSLLKLYRHGAITREKALEHATSRNNLDWQLNFENKKEKQNSEPYTSYTGGTKEEQAKESAKTTHDISREALPELN